MKTFAIAALILLSNLLPLHAQRTGEYGYQFIPDDPTSGYGGQIWLTQPQTVFPIFGLTPVLDAWSSFILTPMQSMNLQVGEVYSYFIIPPLPQTPFPYTGQLEATRYDAQVGFGVSATWDQTNITSMDINGGGYVEYLSAPKDYVTSFVDTNVYGVFEQYNWNITATNISWQIGLTPWNLQQVLADPGFSGSQSGIWMAIPPAVVISNAVGFNGGAFGFNVSSSPGATVIIESSLDLKTWTPVQTNSVGSGPPARLSGPFHFSDPQSFTNSSRFYRVILP